MARVENRWTVRREYTTFFHPKEDDVCYGLRWCVYNPAGYRVSRADTFAEAISYVDEVTRTIAVTIPRLSKDGLDCIPAEQGQYEGINVGKFWNAVRLARYDEALYVHKHELKPLALLLLAWHYKENDCAQF